MPALSPSRRDFLAAYISASSDPSTYGKITVLTIPGQVNGPKLANNAITTDTAVSQDLGVIGRDNQNRIRWGNLLTLPVDQGGLLYVEGLPRFVVLERRTLQVHPDLCRPDRRGIRAGTPPDPIPQPRRERLQA